MTYGEIIEKFRELNPNLNVNDYRPYDFKPNSIYVWISQDDPYESIELAFEYRSYSNEFGEIDREEFVLISNFKRFLAIPTRGE